ncbi:MAG TPA: amino acid adenylation domain-containing protein [Chitinophaga sp.]|uniref:non-ribosomal peptide synthetase n=1 Tax=Chitinophaga sp. TaxID=1869181 RepID=UPI002CB26610|nr:non-ribosomal peptide synthetase [Chitinophaga sp.]HVI48065.1 amino acid adenylation domain-containing protein [Chitinophaga sp.]
MIHQVSSERLSLTPAQLDIYLHQQRHPNAPFYVIGGYYQLKGRLNHGRLEKVILDIINHEPAFRTRLDTSENNPVQYQTDEQETNIPHKDFGEYPEPLAAALSWLKNDFGIPFSLENKLYKIIIVKLSDDDCLIYIKTHHLIMDGWGFSLFIQRLAAAYEGSAPAAASFHFHDAVKEINTALQNTGTIRQQQEYWQNKFHTLPAPLLSPYKDASSALSNRYQLEVPYAQYQQLVQLATDNKASVFHVLLGLLYVYFTRAYQTDELVIGLPVHNRTNARFKKVLGLFVSTTPARFSFGTDLTFNELLNEIKQNQKQDYRYQGYSLGQIHRGLQLFSKGREQLFDVSFSYEKFDYDITATGIDKIIPVTFTHEHDTQPFNLFVREYQQNEPVLFDIQLHQSYFNAAAGEMIAARLTHLINYIPLNAGTPIRNLDWLPAEEQQQLLKINQQPVSTPEVFPTFITALQDATRRFADKTALIAGDEVLTYSQLQEQSDHIAYWLQKQGAGKDVPIAVCMDRCAGLLVSLLAIWKAGSAYVPLDPEYPEERIATIVENAGCLLVITQNDYRSKFRHASLQTGTYDEIMAAAPVTGTLPVPAAADLAYIIYTSGSTGIPKGVDITHGSVINFLEAMAARPGLTEKDTLLAVTTISFDIHVLELYLPLLTGGTVVMAASGEARDAFRLQQLITQHQVTTMQATPATWKMMFLANWQPVSPFKALCGGEALPLSLHQSFQQYPQVELWNMYGPTEATVWASVEKVTPAQKSISIGTPIRHTAFYILDRFGYPAGFELPGELYIGGKCLARGYHRLPEKTAENFLSLPLSSGTTHVYKTGDYVAIGTDYQLRFQSRTDDQVKVRGFRIEQGEIEAVIISHPDVQDCTVKVWQDDQGENYLAAYYVTAPGTAADKTVLTEFLSEKLPAYMIPAVWHQLETLPLTANGKVDKKALPRPDTVHTGNHYIAPGTPVTIRLAAIWSALFNGVQIGVTDDFFMLGGNSITNIQLVNMARAAGLPMETSDIFTLTTIRELGLVLDARTHTTASPTDILPAPAATRYPVSPAQKRLFILQQLEGAATAYNMSGTFMLHGHVDTERLQVAFKRLIARQESLRTSFSLENGEVYQQIHDDIDFNIAVINLPAEETDEERALAICTTAFIQPFNLSFAPLLRCGLVPVTSDKSLLLLDMHHIISDGLSVEIFLHELFRLYENDNLPALPLQYKDYAVWQHGNAPQARIREASWWLQQFEGDIPVLQLPTDFKRPPVQHFEGANFYCRIDAATTEKIRQLATNQKVTLYMMLLAAYNVLLSKYSGQEDIVIGSPVTQRPHADLQSLIGMFVHTLPLRNYPQKTKTFRTFLAAVKQIVTQAFDHPSYPMETLTEQLNIPRDVSRNPLFDVLFVVQPQPLPVITTTDFTLLPHPTAHQVSKFDLTLEATETGEEISLRFEYSSRLFKPSTIERMAGHFIRLLNAITDNPDTLISAIDITSGAEKRKLLYTLNDTQKDFPAHKTLPQIFEEQTLRAPDNIAVAFADKHLSYETLNRRANQLAKVLQAKGVQRGSIVAMFTDRSLEMPTGIFAILKAGGAYLPISPEYPADRIKYMLEDSGATILLTQTAHLHKISFNGICINLEDEQLYQGDTGNIDAGIHPTDPAYVIYTSGSTGKPKGAMLSHRAAVNRIHWMQHKYPLTPQDVILQKTPYTFDVSVWELFWWAFAGASAYFLEPEGEKDPQVIMETIGQQHITVLHFVPSMLNVSLDYLQANTGKWNLSSLRRVFASGEALQVRQVSAFHELLYNVYGTTLHNLYGPTEAAVDVSWFDCTPGAITDTVPIGKPIDNIRLYILDDQQQLQPEGVAGELYISGVGVGIGYLNRPDLTKEKFLPDPFFKGERMYRTGDLARWLPDGNIEYIGRTDHQVKIRGFRIELGEIEQQLLRHAWVKEAVVLTKENKHREKYLCAYLTTTQPVAGEVLREHLLLELPEYMVPAYFIQLDKMPLSPNGKADRKALPEPDISGAPGSGVPYEAPQTHAEKILVKIWEEVLDITPISTGDSFFRLGGDSIKAIQVAAKAAQQGIHITIKDQFRYPVIKQLAPHIVYTETQPADSPEYVPIADIPAYGLSPMQAGMLFHTIADATSYAYTDQVVLDLDTLLDNSILEKSFNILIQKHDILRTVFVYKGMQTPQQVVLKTRYQAIQYSNISHLHKQDQATFLEQWQQADLTQGYQLTEGPLQRLYLVKTGDHSCRIMFSFHHIILDGWSFSLLMSTLLKTYLAVAAGKSILSAPPTQFNSYIHWLSTRDTAAATAFWQTYLEGFSSKTTPAQRRNTSAAYHVTEDIFTLPDTILSGMQQLSAQYAVTVNSILQAVWGLLLQRYCNTNDVVFGAVTSGRPPEIKDVANVAGLLINTIPVRIKCAGETTFIELVQHLQSSALTADSYSYLPLADVQQLSELKNELIDHILVFENFPVDANLLQQQHGAGASLKINRVKFYEQTHYDLNVIIVPLDKLSMRFNYNSEVFDKAQIHQIVQHIQTLLTAIIRTPAISVKDMPLLSATDVEQLNTFNDTAFPSDNHSAIHRLFEVQAMQSPEAIAIVHDGEEISYAELNHQANRIAAWLSAYGTQKEDVVAIIANRSIRMIAGVLGALKAGAAIVPIDPMYPGDRIRYILEDSGAKVALTDESLSVTLPVTSVTFAAALQAAGADAPPDVHITGENLLYVIYTSGTTGRPKGVMLEHRNLVNLIRYQQKENIAHFSGKVLQFTTLCFDVCYQEIFSTLLGGGSLYIIDEEKKKEPPYLLSFIGENEISTIFLPTAYLKFLFGQEQFVQQFPSCIKHIITAGEQLVVSDLLQAYIRTSGVVLHNHYGPSETHVATTYTLHQSGDLVEIPPIGKPVGNNRIYIFDQYRRLQPPGITGEICIAGHNVGRGYIGNKTLTSSKFEPDPFVSGERMYRTGDLGHWRQDGNIIYTGRTDHQVKIRGYRVEPGEIESRLLSHPQIQQAAVTVYTNTHNEQYLTAYIAGTALSATAAKAYLAGILPAYMIPAYIMILEKIPLTSNGKVDRKALPLPENNANDQEEHAAPATITEVRLAAIWGEILNVSHPGALDDFFETGGHSLKASLLAVKLQQEFQVEVPLKQIFLLRNIRQLATSIDTLSKSTHTPITPLAPHTHYALSSAQKRLYILDQFEDSSTAYNIPFVARVKGKIDPDRLEQAIQALIQRHEAFRTSFSIVNGEPVQQIAAQAAFHLQRMTVSPEEVNACTINFIQPFRLSNAPLIRGALLQLADDGTQLLLLDMHHIIADGVTMDILLNELNSLYDGITLPLPPITYKDYAAWQHAQKDSPEQRKQRDYWLQQFSPDKGGIPALSLQTDFPRPAVQSFEGDEIFLDIDAALMAQLKQRAISHSATAFMIAFAAYNILLAKYAGQEDIAVGTPVAGRTKAGLDSIVGLFVNTIVLRNQPAGEISFSNFLNRVKDNLINGVVHQDYQFEELLDDLNIKRDLSRNPLFDTMFSYQHIGELRLKTNDFELSPYEQKANTAKFDLAFSINEHAGKSRLAVNYSTRLFRPGTVRRMGEHYLHILKYVLDQPDILLKDIPLTTPAEILEITSRFNNTAMDYPRHLTIHQRFEQVAAQQPDAIAIVHNGESVTYRQLNEQANQLAKVLREKGAGPDNIIGLMMERSASMVITLMAILKSGAAYLPIVPGLPDDRILAMLRDAGVTLVLTENAALPGHNVTYLEDNNQHEFIIRESITDMLQQKSPDNFDNSLSAPHHLAYVIYTSGSTGIPKGVMIAHKGVINLATWFNREHNLQTNRRVLQMTSIGFDVSVEEIIVPLLSGAGIYIIPTADKMDKARFTAFIKEHQINVAEIVPTLLQDYIVDNEPLESLRVIITGAEKLDEALKDSVLDKGYALYNIYGPTETTVNATAKKCSKGEDTIGTPMANTSIYIMDQWNQVLPAGIPGELCVAGDSLARGYLNSPELNSKKFTDHPLVNGEKIYRTGDLACWTSNGEIKFLGRIDQQIKIRGYRIEPGEIAAVMSKLPGIKDTCVIARTDKQADKYLCAYFTAGQDYSAAEIRTLLSAQLPDYMIPAYFIQLQKMPVTPNGKTDLKALPEPDRTLHSSTPYVAPSGETEERLVAIWQEVLGTTPIGTRDNFFEIGGHSMKAVAVAGRINQHFNADLTLTDLFKAQTIQALSALIANNRHENGSGDRHITLLSPARKQHLFLFPPAMGQGLAYSRLSTVVDSHSLYSFNYIHDDSRIDIYTSLIEKVQPQGPYILLGYSAGGNLAYEVAKALIKKGHAVPHIIMIDVIRRKEKMGSLGESKEAIKAALLDALSQNHLANDNEVYVEKLVEDTYLFTAYVDELVNDGCIPSNIHLIKAEEEKEYYWEGAVTGHVTVHQGKGEHIAMLGPQDNLLYNAGIISEILTGLDPR